MRAVYMNCYLWNRT